jgi:hypothetical protein
MLTGVTALTTRDAVEVTVPETAVMVVVPAPMPVASPEDATIVAILALEALQVTDAVTSLVELSLNVPAAVNCCVPPTNTVAVDGAIAMDFKTTAFTVKVADPVIELDAALIVVVPEAIPDARPVEEIDAVVPADDVHATDVDKSFVVPSEYVASAENCCCPPMKIDGVDGETVRDFSVAAGVGLDDPEPEPPQPLSPNDATKRVATPR